MKGIIYKATNTLNGKVYVGQTTQSLAKRASQHKSMADNGYNDAFHSAIRESGWESFSWEEIEIINMEAEPGMKGTERFFIRPLLLEAENKHITELKSYDPVFGYNTAGGVKPSLRTSEQLQNNRTKVTVYHLHRGRRYKTYPTFKAAKEEIGVSPLHNKAIDYNPELVTFQCPRCVKCVAIRFPDDTKPPLNINIKPIFAESKEAKKKRRFYESPYMRKKAEEQRKRLELKLKLQEQM